MLPKKKLAPLESSPPSLWSIFFKKNWLLVTITIVLLFAIQASWIAGAFYFSKVIDLVAEKRSLKLIIYASLGLGVSWLLYPALTAAKDATDMALLPQITTTARTEIMERIFHAFHRYVTMDPQSMGIENIIRTPAVMRQMFEQIRDTVLPLAICLLMTMIFFFKINTTLGIVYFIGIAIFIACVCLLSGTSLKKGNSAEITQTVITENITDVLTNVGMVAGNNTIGKEMQTIHTLEKVSRKEQGYIQGFAALTRGMFTLLYLGLFSVIFVVSIWLNQKNRLSTGMLTTVTFVLTYMITYFEDMSHQVIHLLKNTSLLSKTQGYLDQLQILTDIFPDGTLTTPPQNGEIHINNLSMRYSQHLPAIFENFTMLIPAGQCLLLRGENGCGKSSLIKILSGQLPFQTGTVILGGVDITATQASILHQAIVYLPQTPQLLNRSVFENIAYGTSVDRTFVQNLLDQFQITFATLDSPVGKNGSHFSGGQRQILCLLRIFCHTNTHLLLLDEPTSALDPTTRDKAMELIAKIIVGRTTILITHDEQLTSYANRIVFLDQGKIKEDTLKTKSKEAF